MSQLPQTRGRGLAHGAATRRSGAARRGRAAAACACTALCAALIVCPALFCASAPKAPGATPAVVKTFPKPLPAARGASAPTPEQLAAAADKLRPLAAKFGPPQPGDWVQRHPEQGQTFRAYLASNPVLPRTGRVVLYVQPLGDFTASQRAIVELAAEFLGLFFNLEARILPDVPLAVIPAEARRVPPWTSEAQILATYVLADVLKPRLPEDAAACIALTASDLWPGPGWNFVFGMASTRDRVGVWSINRNGDPVKERAVCLLRTLKTAAHETAHMFSLSHCIAYACVMCGSNSLAESDRRPLALCPECAAKVCWATETDPLARYGLLSAFCKKHGLAEAATFYEKAAAAIGPAPARPGKK